MVYVKSHDFVNPDARIENLSIFFHLEKLLSSYYGSNNNRPYFFI